MKRAIRILLCLTLSTLFMMGCGGSANEESSQSVDKTEVERNELSIRISGDMPVLDPYCSSGGGADYQIWPQIFDGLVKFDGSNQTAVLPCLAESWDISDDQLDFTFYLRKDVKFHDGSDFTADDVVFSVDRFKTSSYTSSKALMVDFAEKVDDYTVILHLKYAYPCFIRQLASFPWKIVSKSAVEQYGENNFDMMVGTGAYKLSEWNIGTNVKLVANKDYFEGDPYYKVINFKLITDDQTALIAFENGELDFTRINNGLDAQYIRDLQGAKLLEIKRAAAYVIMFNVSGDYPDVAKIAIRQALAHAVNRKELVELVWDGEAPQL